MEEAAFLFIYSGVAVRRMADNQIYGSMDQNE